MTQMRKRDLSPSHMVHEWQNQLKARAPGPQSQEAYSSPPLPRRKAPWRRGLLGKDLALPAGHVCVWGFCSALACRSPGGTMRPPAQDQGGREARLGARPGRRSSRLAPRGLWGAWATPRSCPGGSCLQLRDINFPTLSPPGAGSCAGSTCAHQLRWQAKGARWAASGRRVPVSVTHVPLPSRTSRASSALSHTLPLRPKSSARAGAGPLPPGVRRRGLRSRAEAPPRLALGEGPPRPLQPARGGGAHPAPQTAVPALRCRPASCSLFLGRSRFLAVSSA